MATFQSLPGFREFYPDALARRNHIFRLWRQTAVAFGFAEYDAPVLEPLELYKTKSGDEIEAQLFSFTDKGGREVALRPEMTPTVCRMVGAKANALKRPIKWFSIAEYYRYERAQKGRERAFFQFNADLFAEPGPEAEIELIALLTQCLKAFGLTEQDFYIRLSDRNLWFFYLEALGLDEPRIRAVLSAVDKFEKVGDDAFKPYAEQFGPLDLALKQRVLEFLQIKTLASLEQTLAPLGGEKLAARLGDWRKLLDGLAAMGLSPFIEVDLGVVRGLAYYTGFVFEAFDRKGELRAIAGGGRYNDLVKKLGGPDLPAVGFAIGDVTLGLLLDARGLMPAFVQASDVYCVIGGAAERQAAFADVNALRAAGFKVDYPLKDVPFGKQFKLAADSGAKLALIYGPDELAKNVVKLRDLTTRTETDVPREQVQAMVRDFFSTD
ncbi:histidine--tRNA ligase [Opitutus terrae]|uniref:Histidine--tRNA ligase n=1 Tax=Opitutus terrae (strain DSM 11246 / JCM 15787 / PB90-1) TaxID=452637 RepID=SYH_OPITP|nr:histidine--tRNA ligase [Opitutus terrae]B1ZUW6.1 RecName: Full=Histidine--tRNA ligase; AltName: Full=Histidyl-tRNA synthetase; Short=HisRS [Opitutus terrae PB90-1]ACB75936.1 histidyl-tRNA synthetase [Opitutus terrae PB90-1]